MTLRLTARLVTRGPYATHTGATSVAVDRAVRRDQKGRPVLAGTGLAGALRAAYARRRGRDRTDGIFGPWQAADVGERGNQLDASRVVVYDASYASSTTPQPEVRQHVGIERRRLAAKEQILFDAEVWPAGLEFDLAFDCDEDVLGDLVDALDALASPEAGIGAGPCPVEIRDMRCEVLSASPEDLFKAAVQRWVDVTVGEVTTPWDGTLPAPDASTGGGLRLVLKVRCIDPLVSRVPIDRKSPMAKERKIDHLPFAASRIQGGERRWHVGLAGSGFRGVLRTRAERIVGYLGRSAVPDPWNTKEAHAVACAFGWASDEHEGAGASGRVRFSDLLTEEGIVGDDPSAALDHPRVEPRPRVRIDRLTGGTYGSALFTDHVVRADSLLVGTIDILPSPDGLVDDRDVALLIAALRDVLEGQIGVGASSHSGYGTLRLESLALIDGAADEVEVGVRDGQADWPEPLAERVRVGWQSLREEVAAHAGTA